MPTAAGGEPGTGSAPRRAALRAALAVVVAVVFLLVATRTTVASLGSFCLTTEASAGLGPAF